MNKKIFLDNFFSQMKQKWHKNYTEEEKNNFSILYDMLEGNNENVVKVADLPMADGKSQFILFYCNEKYIEDKSFSAIVVKKTIKECEEFCISLGLKDDVLKDKNDLDIETLFYGKRAKNNIDKSIYYKIKPNTELFKAIAIKGFNYRDCMYYERPINFQKIKMQEEKFKTKVVPNDYEGEYKIGRCNKCKRYDCPVKTSRKEAQEHRIIALSHARLFLLNNKEESLDDLLYFKNGKKKQKRQILIIDEKMQMTDIKNIKMREIIGLKSYVTSKSFKNKTGKRDFISDISNVEKAFMEFGKIEANNDIKKVSTKSFSKMEFSEEFELYIAQNKPEYNNVIQFLNNFQEQESLLVSNEYLNKSEEKREFTSYKYIDISAYNNKVENTVLLDATASIDIDYKKSNFVGSKLIAKSKKKINLFLPQYECNLSKSNLVYLMFNKQENFLRILAEINHLLACTDKKTLIVTYNSLLQISDFKKFLGEHLDINLERDKIIHFGQYTTGVNFLSDYENIIFLGELRKSPAYYNAKLLALNMEETKENMQEIRSNEFLVDVIQQIGRTSYRKNITPNVYIFDKKEILDYYQMNLGKFFEVKEEVYNNKQMCFYNEGYDMSKRGKSAKYYYAIWYMACKIEEDMKQTGTVQDAYTFTNKEIKDAVGYEGNKFGRDIVEPLQKASSKEFLVYNTKNRTITLNIPILEKILR